MTSGTPLVFTWGPGATFSSLDPVAVGILCVPDITTSDLEADIENRWLETGPG
jgi:hypothetical protein